MKAQGKTMLDSAETEVDERLVAEAAGGDFAAFERLIGTYETPLWHFVYGFVNSYDDAGDIVQQTLIQVYRSLPSLGNPTRFRAWLFTIARHKCLDLVRRNTPVAFSALSPAPETDPEALFADPAPLPDEIIERHETQVLLRDAIATLPERQRAVVNLRYTTDLTFAEIAEVLGSNESSVKTLFQRAKSQLRFYIRQHS